MTRKKRKLSALSRQQFKKSRRTQGLYRRVWFLSAITLAVALVGSLLLFHYGKPSPLRKIKLANPSQSEQIEWKISLLPSEETQLTDSTQNDIIAFLRQNLKDGSESELKNAARSLQKKHGLARVGLVRHKEDGIVVTAVSRKPFITLEVGDQLRFLTKEGVIFGEATAESAIKPLIRGIFPNGKRVYLLGEDNALVSSVDESLLVQESLELLSEAKARHIDVSELQYTEFRGFTIINHDKQVEALLGRKPFASKLKRLDEIFGKLDPKRNYAIKIELDYNNKAFIKEIKI